MKIKHVTVIYPVTLRNLEVPDDATVDEKREIILQRAAEYLPREPIIHDCSDEELID